MTHGPPFRDISWPQLVEMDCITHFGRALLVYHQDRIVNPHLRVYDRLDEVVGERALSQRTIPPGKLDGPLR